MAYKDNIKNSTEPSAESFINYIVDEDGVIWMEAGWDSNDEAIDSFARLLYELHSGRLMAESLEFVKDKCQTLEQKKQYQKLLTILNDLFFAESELSEHSHIQSDKPVVSPTRVFPQYGDQQGKSF